MAELVPKRKLKVQGTYFKVPAWAGRPQPGTRLDVLKAGKVVGKHELDDDPYFLFGRLESVVDYVLFHHTVSRVHFAIVHHNSGSCFIVDLDSSHGTKVNGARLASNVPTKIQHGDRLQVGQSSKVYVLHVPGAAAAAPAKPGKPSLDAAERLRTEEQQPREQREAEERQRREREERERRLKQEAETKASEEREKREQEAREREEEERMERLELERLERLAQEREHKRKEESGVDKFDGAAQPDRNGRMEGLQGESADVNVQNHATPAAQTPDSEEIPLEDQDASRRQGAGQDEKRLVPIPHSLPSQPTVMPADGVPADNPHGQSVPPLVASSDNGVHKRPAEGAEEPFSKRSRSQEKPAEGGEPPAQSATESAQTQVQAKAEAEKAAEKARAKEWIDAAKQLLLPVFDAQAIDREGYKNLLSATIKQPFDRFSDRASNLVALKECLDAGLAKLGHGNVQSDRRNSAFRDLLDAINEPVVKVKKPSEASSLEETSPRRSGRTSSARTSASQKPAPSPDKGTARRPEAARKSGAKPHDTEEKAGSRATKERKEKEKEKEKEKDKEKQKGRAREPESQAGDEAREGEAGRASRRHADDKKKDEAAKKASASSKSADHRKEASEDQKDRKADKTKPKKADTAPADSRTRSKA